MEPTLQFDPANLSIWYRPLHQGEGDPINLIAQAALLGDQAGARDQVRCVDNHELRVRCAHMLSAVCHEQRHFVDMLLTNFGQSMIRQFTALLVNLPDVVKIAKAEGRLGIPLTVYGDDVRRSVLGVKGDNELGKLARDMRSRAKMINEDAFEHTIPGRGVVSVGGRAQLEALAFITQIALLQKEFGHEIARAVQEDMPDRLHMRNQYAWAATLGITLGLTPPGEVPEGTFSTLGPPVSALLYGALMIRRWGQKQSEVEGGHSGSAVARMDPLFVRLRSTGDLARATSTNEAWQAVDRACAAVFGRSAREELQHDLDNEERYCDSAAKKFGGDDTAVVQFLRGVHAARLSLVAIFDDSPETIIDPDRYGRLFDAIDPVPILVDAAGGDDVVPAGWSTLWAGSSELGASGRVIWSWAKAPVGVIAVGSRIHIVKDVDSWKSVVKDLMPLAKLLLRGRRQPLVLGPELNQAEILLKEWGIEPRFDPLFAVPLADTSSDAFWYLTGQQSAVCDACSLPLARGSGNYVPAVVFRQNDRTATWLVQKYGGGEFGLFLARKDWTGWLLCDACHAEVGQLATVELARARRTSI